MKKSKVIAALLAVFIILPIWFYLIYYILSAVGASQLVWFLFWVYVPVSIFVTSIGKFIEG